MNNLFSIITGFVVACFLPLTYNSNFDLTIFLNANAVGYLKKEERNTGANIVTLSKPT